ncbi:hypothetical protein LCGC14_2348950, partial [marine sediment metagenome]
DSGMRDFEINNLLAEIFRRQEVSLLRQNLQEGLITREVFNAQFNALKNLKNQLTKQLRQRNIQESQSFIGQKPIEQTATPNLFFAEQQPQTLQQVQQLKSPTQSLFFKPSQKLAQPQLEKLRLAFASAQTAKQRQALLQKISQLQKQSSVLGLSSVQLSKQVSAQKQPQLSLLSQPQVLGQKQVSQLGTENIFLRGAKTKPRPRPKITKVPKPKIIKLPKGVSKTKLVKALVKLKKQGVNVVVGQGKKQKIIARNLPPFKALKKGRDFVDENIVASFHLKKSGKKTAKKDIKPFNVGRKFRPSKRNVLIQVEKSKFRLDHPKEVAQLKAAKRRKPTKKKRKKKK